MLFEVVQRVVAALFGYLLAMAVVQLLPHQTMYPSEENLQQVYRDSRGVCYMYQKVQHACAEQVKDERKEAVNDGASVAL